MPDQGTLGQQHEACLVFPWFLIYCVLYYVLTQLFFGFMIQNAFDVFPFFFVLEDFWFN